MISYLAGTTNFYRRFRLPLPLPGLTSLTLIFGDAFSAFTFGLGLYLGFWLVPAPRRFGAASRFSFGKKGLSG